MFIMNHCQESLGIVDLYLLRQCRNVVYFPTLARTLLNYQAGVKLFVIFEDLDSRVNLDLLLKPLLRTLIW